MTCPNKPRGKKLPVSMFEVLSVCLESGREQGCMVWVCNGWSNAMYTSHRTLPIVRNIAEPHLAVKHATDTKDTK